MVVVGVGVAVIGGSMFYIERKGEFIAAADQIETALESARFHGEGSEVRRALDNALCARVGKTDDLVKAIRAEAA